MAISYTLLILAVLWAAFFLWPIVQRRLEGGRRGSIGSLNRPGLNRPGLMGGRRAVAARLGSSDGVGGSRSVRSDAPHALSSLPASSASFGTDAGRPAGLPAGLPMSADAQRRRRDALIVLGGGVLATLVLAVVSASVVAWAVHAVVGLAFAGYIVALVQIRRRAQERRATVHFLPQPVVTPTLVLRRSVSS